MHIAGIIKTSFLLDDEVSKIDGSWGELVCDVGNEMSDGGISIGEPAGS